MIQYIANKVGELAYELPDMFIVQVHRCCSAEIISSVHAGYSKVTQKRHENAGHVRVKKDPAELKAIEKLFAINKDHALVLTEEGCFRVAALLLAHRITQCENPYFRYGGLEPAGSQKFRVDGYYWPCRVWSMYDRTDLKKQGVQELNTARFGFWMEDNSQEMGITTYTVDGESVHAKGSGFSPFRSEKPNGYGTIRIWNLIVEDMRALEEWYGKTMNEILQQLTFKQSDNAGKFLW